MPAGRPSSYSEAIADEIFRRMCEGETVTAICALEHMPHISTLWRWEQANEEFRKLLARAREARAHVWAEEGIQIADDGSLDSEEGEDGRRIVNHEHIQRSRLRVDTRLKLAAKHNPAVYGDKIQQEVTGKDGGPIETSDVSEREIMRRIAMALASGVKDGA